MKTRHCLSGFFAFPIVLLVLAPAGWGAGWWNHPWQYRRAVTIPATEPTGLPGDDVAVVSMPTAGLIQPDDKSIRVMTPQGKEMPSRLLMVGPGDLVRLAFAVQKNVSKYYVYFSNPKAPEGKKLDIRRGVLLETYKYPGGGIRRLDQAKKVFNRASTFIGRDFQSRIFLGHNPFSAESRLAGRFTGWLICRRSGKYTFSCSSRDASFLLIDDKLVVDNGGWHRPQRNVHKQGDVELDVGLHKLTFYHVSLGGDPVAVAAWRPPGAGRIWTIPAEAFAPVVTAAPGPLEQYAKALTIDFLYEHAGEAFMMNRYYHRYTFQAQKSGRVARNMQWRWDFGDGQKGRGEKIEHVYLKPGEYTVTLSVRAFAGEMKRTNRIFVSRPWARITENRLDGIRPTARIVSGYDFKTLPVEAVGEAVLLLNRARDFRAVIRAGNALVMHEKAPKQLLKEAMPIYAEALIRAGEAGQAVAALVKAAGMNKSPAVCATLLVRAGQIALTERNDADTAMGLFQMVIKEYSALTTSPAIRDERIGMGDVWRARGNAEKAKQAYTAAKPGSLEGKNTAAIAKGDLAHHVEEYLHKRQYEWAQEYLDRWDRTFPLDKLEGYSSLLRAKLLVARRRYAAAVVEAETLVGVNPISNYAAELLMLAADAYEKLRKPEKAAAALKRVVKEYPESPLAAKAASKLKGR